MIYAIAVPIADSIAPEVYAMQMNFAGKSMEYCLQSGNKLCMLSSQRLSPHARARNDLFMVAMEAGVERLLFMDSDMFPDPYGLGRLAETMNRTGAQIVTGQFFQRLPPYACTWSQFVEGKARFVEIKPYSGEHQLAATGLAFTLIDLSWVRKNIQAPYFRMICTHNCSVWEDGDFCNRVKAAGGTIIGDSNVQVGHMTFAQMVHAGNVLEFRMRDNEIPGDKNGSRSEHQDGKPEDSVESVQQVSGEQKVQKLQPVNGG